MAFVVVVVGPQLNFALLTKSLLSLLLGFVFPEGRYSLPSTAAAHSPI